MSSNVAPRGASRARIELEVSEDQITISNRSANPYDKPANPARAADAR